MASGNDGPLAGVRVIDASTILAGPLAAQLLGDFGADVVKIEHPRHGDPMRNHGAIKDGQGLWWKMISRNKRCLGLDLSAPEGGDVFRRLAAGADVLVENFRPGTLERWGLGPDALHVLNPALVVVRVTGFGQTGPYAHRPGFGTLAEAMSGFAAMTGEPEGPPTLPPFGLADAISGITAAAAASMALHHRAAHGEGQVIDLSLYEPLMTVLGPYVLAFDQLGMVPERLGNRSADNAPRNTYRTKDGAWVAVSTSANSIAERVLRLVGHPELCDEPWFGTGAGRAAHAQLLDRLVGDWVGARTRDDVLAAFEEADAAIAPVYDVGDLVIDPHVVARGSVALVPDHDFGVLRMQDVLFRMSATPGGIRWTGPPLGAHTDEILLGELGMDDATVAALRERGVVA